jgi:protease-4
VQPEILKAGDYKDMGSPTRPLTDEERRIFQAMLDSVHAQFIEAVASGRAMAEDRVRTLADGRIFSGEQANEEGLVDALGGLEDAIAMAAERGGVVGEPRVTWARPGREPWWLRLLFNNMAPSGWLSFPVRPALGLQLLYAGPFLR